MKKNRNHRRHWPRIDAGLLPTAHPRLPGAEVDDYPEIIIYSANLNELLKLMEGKRWRR